MDTNQAIQLIQDTRKAAWAMRKSMEAFWTLAIHYDAGKQWAWTTTQYGRYVTKHLGDILDPRREDVRVTMPIIHQNVIRMQAALQPKRIASTCKAASGSPNDLVVSRLGDDILSRHIKRTKGLLVLKEKEAARCVLGTAIVRRCMFGTPTGKQFTRGRGPNIKRYPIRNFSYRWAHVYPWEIIRDPSASSTNPDRDEEIFIQEKIRPVAWVERELGQKVGDVQSTIGELLASQQHIHSAHSLGGDYQRDSKMKGVVVYEAWFKDRDSGDGQDWRWMVQAYCDPKRDAKELRPIGQVRENPYHGLPFHFFVYDTQIEAPWGIGISHLGMAGQNLVNLAWTHLMRTQIHSVGKWMFEEGTIENPSKTLSNRIDVPIIFKRPALNQAQPILPQRVGSPPVAQPTMDMLALAPQWMERALNLSEVQFGITSKRGESGAAVEQKIAQASAPIERMRELDDLTYSDLLYGTLADLTNNSRFRLDQARDMLGPDVPEEQAILLFRQPVTQAVASVEINPTQTHPRTPGETQENIVGLVQAQLLQPEEGQRVLTEQGVEINPSMARSRQKQLTEIEGMIGGRASKPSVADRHEWHLWVLRDFIDSPRFGTLPDEARELVHEHYALHEYLQQMQAAGMAQMASPAQGQPTPPAEAAQMAAESTPGLVGPGMNVA